MNKDWVLTQESFETLLAWLATDRDEAGRKYEFIRRRLIKIFTCRRCAQAEDLADETINRVTKKLGTIQENFTGDPALYFYGVANKVCLEYLRKPATVELPITAQTVNTNVEHEYACLEKCMQKLTPNNRDLLLQYYHSEKRAKIDQRKQLAQTLGIALNALRIRAHRIRNVLHECVQTCVQEATA